LASLNLTLVSVFGRSPAILLESNRETVGTFKGMRSLIGLIILFYIVPTVASTENESKAVEARGGAPVAELVAAEERLQGLTTARRHLGGLSAAFPDRARRIDGGWFAWAEGRLLLEEPCLFRRALRHPQPVVDAFEGEGFYWGGKWLFFDNMQFEYRPELFEF
jgi:hypothetical protein